MHRVVGAMNAGETYVQAVADNINSGIHDVEDGFETGTYMVRHPDSLPRWSSKIPLACPPASKIYTGVQPGKQNFPPGFSPVC